MKSSNNNVKTLIPKHCPSCGNILIEKGNVHLYCDNKKCPEQAIQTILYWVTKNNCEQIAESTIRLLHDNKFISSVIDLYNLDYSKIIELDGIGKKKVENLKQQIEKTKNIDIVQFLSRLGIELCGEKAVKKLGINTIQQFWNFDDEQYVIGQKLIEYRESHIKELLDLMHVLNVQDVKENISKGENKMKVCMTGKGPLERKELIKIIESKGHEFVASMTKDTNVLICENLNSDTVKLQKALKLGVKLVSYEEFFN
jgi:DNA ligase (NAD+)